LNARIDRFDAEDRAFYKKNKPTLAFLGRLWDYPSDHNVMYLLNRRRDRRPADDWKTQSVPDAKDAPIPKGKWCKVPLLVFTSGRGRIRQGDPEAIKLQKNLPAKDVRLIVVTKSGHEIHDQQTEHFNRELLAFLERLEN
jgi:pimeloyl-ACP methyl ester carboxylesterase